MNLKQSLALVLCIIALPAGAVDITGAGASFPFPLYSKWAEAYKAETGVKVNYQSIGSSGGLKQIKEKTVNFAASDYPLKYEELQSEGLVQFPAIIGGVVPIINVAGIQPGQLRLTGPVLAEIFMGQILRWDDVQIQELNPNLKFPKELITVVHRADGSGTTAIFVDYLSKISPSWKAKVGSGPTVKWPAVSSIGGKGNEGVTATVARIKNTIGYAEYAYVKKNNLGYTLMMNASGNYVAPSDKSFTAASTGTDWTKFPGMATFITNALGEKAWPITAASFVLLYKNADDPAASAEVMRFFDFGFRQGQDIARNLEYVPLPSSTFEFIRRSVWTQVQ
ncbi:phosphate ABC transporter substrate-binding protein, PhoT family [Polynucleobacter meluiroseus]|uniref:Phosphate-binding protein PstS n=1 Tax=Polynucleobacter meluiroseus TaxID=1938814 RepID=A0A240E3U0_9BURK|nr:phosphate ABC transporter substrate-binding protein PstS [Polynucleobacter meluiroseus]SNX29540.1 phosphate ABC transporter substrate-binding protein, PhoT family [Polynucleobacter meluiroseus]